MKTTCPKCRQRLLHRAHLGVDGSGIVYNSNPRQRLGIARNYIVAPPDGIEDMELD